MSGPARKRVVFAAAVFQAAVGVAASAWAQSKPAQTDAQIEANVLRALASAPELSTQNIQSSAVYGTVTLSGNVHDETLRVKAENLVARAEGVKKVVDELTLGDTPSAAVAQSDAANAQGTGPESQPVPASAPEGMSAPPPDGSYTGQGAGAPAPVEQGYNTQNGNSNQNGGQPGYNQPGYNQQPGGGGYAPQAPYAGNNGYPGSQGPQGNGYPGPQGAQGNGYPGYPNGNDGRQAYGPPPQPPNGAGNYNYGGQGGGQAAGLAVTVPSGANLQVRINRGIDSNHIQPGTSFTGTVLNDVVAGGAVAVPRGAQVQGTVVDAKSAGVLKGEGELALQLTSVTLGGQSYPVNTVVWQRAGRDKTLGTVNSALGLGALGAVFGGLAGGGAGAAIGAGVGGAVGVGASAASPGGRVIVPPESVLTFSLAQPLAVKTVSQNEMQRMAYAAGPGPGVRPVVVRRPYYGPYGPYGPYGYPYGAYYYGR